MDKKLYEALVYAYELLKEQAETGHYPVNALAENGGKGYEPITTALRTREGEYLNENSGLNIPVVSGSCLEKADMWYCTHKNHVNKLYWQAHIGYAPTEALDINNPELWKPEHWKWYLDNYR